MSHKMGIIRDKTKTGGTMNQIVICHKCGGVFEWEWEHEPPPLPDGCQVVDEEYYCDKCCDNGFLKVPIATESYTN